MKLLVLVKISTLLNSLVIKNRNSTVRTKQLLFTFHFSLFTSLALAVGWMCQPSEGTAQASAF